MTWAIWAVTAIGGLGGLAGFGAAVTAWTSRGKTKAEAAQIITGSAMTLVHELEEDAKDAREELRAVRAQASAELALVRDEARKLAQELHALRMAIMSPEATVESLRLLVTGPSRSNGTPR